MLLGGVHDRKETFSHDEMTPPILKIATTDVRNKCIPNFQGTLSAAPLVAAGVALDLEAEQPYQLLDLRWLYIFQGIT